jgi:hypothetical protein
MLFFLLFPGFIIFGNLAMGTFEALLFFLLSFYFLLKDKPLLSAIFMSISFFTRYQILILIPFILIYLLIYKKNSSKKYLTYLFIISVSMFLIIYSVFGFNLIRDTVFYHFESNIKLSLELANWVWQYLTLGFFTNFIAIISLAFGYFKKDYKLMLFSAYPLFYDLTILLLFRQVIYHYFIFALPLLAIAFGKAFSRSRFVELRVFLISILLLSLIANYKSLVYYFDKNKNFVFDELVNYTLEFTQKDDLIFGEPRTVNYISFVTNRRIVNNYFDSDLKYLNFKGLEKVIEEVREAKPKIIVVDRNYYEIFYSSFEKEYENVKEWNIFNYYHLILMKRKY